MIDIRRAAPADLAAVVDLHARFCEADGHIFSADVATRAFTPLLADDSHGVVWLVDDPSARGYAVVTWGWSIESGGRDALVDEIYAEPTGTGVGRALMERLLADTEERGIRSVFLETEVGNESARRFYRRLGFESEDSVWMTRRL